MWETICQYLLGLLYASNTKVIHYWDRLGRKLLDFVFLDLFN